MNLGDDKENAKGFCTVCQTICDLSWTCFDSLDGSGSFKSYGLEQSFEELQLSALADCVFCAFRLGILTDSDIGQLEEWGPVRLVVNFNGSEVSDSACELDFEYIYNTDDERSSSINASLTAECARYEDEGSSPTELPRVSSPMTASPAHHSNSSLVDCTTSSDETFVRLQQWISDCDKKHESCGIQIGRDPDFLPSRLVCVENKMLRLCSKESLPWRTRYVTLSHCWGGIVPFQLREENMAALESGIDHNALPKTFQDAIEATRRLGISYIWIDSLCIVQDSESDWRLESSLMDRIFENAHLCIAATHARNSTEGLFSDRASMPANWSKILRIEAKWVTGDPAIWVLWDARVFHTHVERSRLLSRGWVIQERVLSPRIVYYAKGQIFWECSESRACELLSEPQGIDCRGRDTKPSLASVPHDLISRHNIWQGIVEDYCEVELSYPQKDKAVAIAGVARRLIRPKDYCAGLWRPLMHIHLCWWRGTNNVGDCRSGAPTWSWMSLMGEIYFSTYVEGRGPYVPLRHILNVEIPLRGDDQFGDMHEGASIHLRALLFQVPLGKFYREYFSNRIIVGLYTYDVTAHLDVSSTQESQHHLGMPVSFTRYELYALILVPTAQSGKFERRGLISWTLPEEGDDLKRQEEFVEKWRNLLDFYSRSTDGIDQTLRTTDRLEDFDLPLYNITLD